MDVTLLDEIKQAYDDIGYSTEAVDAKISDLFTAIERFAEKSLQAQSDAIQQLHVEYGFCETHVRTICERFMTDPSPKLASLDDMLLVPRLAELRNRLAVLQKEEAERVAAITTELNAVQEMSSAMGDGIPFGCEEVGEIISDSRLAQVQDAKAICIEKLNARRGDIAIIAEAVHDIIVDLDLQEDEHKSIDVMLFNAMNSEEGLDKLGFHIDTLHHLARRKDEVDALRTERKELLQRLAQDISRLWNMLDVDQSSRQEFLTEHNGLGRRVIDACEHLLEDLTQRKQAAIPNLIASIRSKIKDLWVELCVHENEQRKFAPAFSDVMSEEVLDAHHIQYDLLETRARTLRPILGLITKRKELLQEITDYEASLSDANRFKIPGRMLEEEKVRKVMKKTYPNLIKKLTTSIEQWEAETNSVLVLHGEAFLANMLQQEEAKKIREAEKKDGLRQAIRPKATPVKAPTSAKKRPFSSLKKNTMRGDTTNNESMQKTPRKRMTFQGNSPAVLRSHTRVN